MISERDSTDFHIKAGMIVLLYTSILSVVLAINVIRFAEREIIFDALGKKGILVEKIEIKEVVGYEYRIKKLKEKKNEKISNNKNY